MSTTELIAALRAAAARGDLAATPEILAQLEMRLSLERVVQLCAELPLPPGTKVPPPPWQAA